MSHLVWGGIGTLSVEAVSSPEAQSVPGMELLVAALSSLQRTYYDYSTKSSG